jgi:ribosomal protein S18 acetylase RimI-like enzyme
LSLKGEVAVIVQDRAFGVEATPCVIREIESKDVPGAARLHRVVFPEYFLTHMGQGLVERFYSEFVDCDGNYGYVAICGKEMVGAVIGTLDYQRCFTQFYRRHFPRLALTLVGRIIVDPYIRRHLVSRMVHVRQALHSIAARRQQVSVAAESPAPDQTLAHLLSIGVHPVQRSSGLAEQLVDRYCDALWEDGWQCVDLSVRPQNARAIAFYEKTGWQQIASSPSALQYSRSTRPASLGGGNP